MICGVCGNSNPDHATFCDHCGQSLTPIPAPRVPGSAPLPPNWPPPAGAETVTRPGLSFVLIILIIYLVLANPLYRLLGLFSSVFTGSLEHAFEVVQHTHVGSRYWANSMVFLAFFVLFAASAIWGFVAGMRLWTHRPGAVGFAKRYLIIGGLLLILLSLLNVMTSLVHLAVDGRLVLAAQLIIFYAISLAIQIGGLIYLYKSPRVAAAYPQG